MKLIVEQVPVKASLFSSEPPAGSDFSYVYKGRANYILIENGQIMSRAELRANGVSLRYKVKRGGYNYFQKNMVMACNDLGRHFLLTINMKVNIADPVKIIQTETEDIEALLNYKVQDIYEVQIGNYNFEDYRRLQLDVKAMHKKANLEQVLQDVGLRLADMTATISLSKEDEAHFNKIERMNKEIEIHEKEVRSAHLVEMTSKGLEKERLKTDLLFNSQLEDYELEREKKRRLLELEMHAEIIEKYDKSSTEYLIYKTDGMKALRDYLLKKEDQVNERSNQLFAANIEMMKQIDVNAPEFDRKIDALNPGRKDITPLQKELVNSEPESKPEAILDWNLDTSKLFDGED